MLCKHWDPSVFTSVKYLSLTCSLHINLFNKDGYADVQISITTRIQALRDVFILTLSVNVAEHNCV